MRLPLRATVSLSLADVAAAVGADHVATQGPAAVSGVATDSRDVQPGDLFVARRGRTSDGHAFVAAAVQAGAVAVLAERPVQVPGVSVLRVPDATEALGRLARAHRRRMGLPLVAVTGSNGKTTTKEMIAAIFAEHLGGAERVLSTRGNFNNHVGLPLTLLSATPAHRLGVVEMGMSAPGEIAALTEIAEPTVGLITNAARAHLAGLGTVDAVARAKAELWEHMDPRGTAVVPADDARLASLGARYPGRRIRFGEGEEAEVRVVSATPDGVAGMSVGLALPEGALQVQLPLLGRHNARNAAAAAAATLALGVSPVAVGAGLSQVRLPAHRTRLLSVAGALVLDDCYNANPDSVSAALDTLAELPGSGRLGAVVGELRELGSASRALHAEVGLRLARRGVTCVIGVGPEAAPLCDAARQAGVSEVVHVADATAAGQALRERLRSGDRWLVKGSRGVGLEAVIQNLETARCGEGNG